MRKNSPNIRDLNSTGGKSPSAGSSLRKLGVVHMKVYLNASVFIFPVISKSDKAYGAKEILSKIEDGALSAITSPLTLDEVVWVVWQEVDRETGISAGRDVLKLPGLDLVSPNREILSLALRLIEKYGLSPRDAIHSATMKSKGVEIILSDDEDFDRLEGIKRYPIEKFVEELERL